MIYADFAIAYNLAVHDEANASGAMATQPTEFPAWRPSCAFT
jgi:hypothetical protein